MEALLDFDKDIWLPLLKLVAAGALALLVVALASRIAGRLARRAGSEEVAWLLTHLRAPLRLLAPALAVRLLAPSVRLPEALAGVLDHAVLLVVILAAGWTLVALTSVADELVRDRFVLHESDNLRARRIHTRFRLIRRVVVIVVGVLTFAAMLVTFPAARALGTGLLASAGIAGLVVGLAARPTLETLLAGLQMALTEPINLDDVVIVEGEWGRIEEIRATYVVVRIWDLRRLVVPIRYFLSTPFENWTRTSADLLAAVTVDVDYRTPVDEVRTAAEQIVESSALWDREFWNLQVVEAGDRCIRLRVLVSAANSGDAWDMRCEIREKLVAWLQHHHPETLPRVRVEGPTRPVGTV